ncbi:peroxidase-related enzyme [Cohaesibacter celericrescens]|uniref:Alkylhydroperoxidase n=1 Tax=Cohaesibacter celericrescens TaxID=2067669 RepID=A0A2N5XPY8_9HYPH|nr:peroxidase-related enzyme [Cohaesibacter celericrescens]PLW76507.1 alkylhydroperoxidase [Cohaesibacter celericrescens]
MSDHQGPEAPKPQSGKAVIALDLSPMDPMPEDIAKYFAICADKLGMVPNVLVAHSFDEAKFRAFSALYNNLMLDESGLSKLEREMIAVVVSSINRCLYCLVAHGQAVRALSGDPLLGELLVMNYRAADLSPRHRAMLDYAAKLTEEPEKMTAADRQALSDVGFSDLDIWDIANVIGFFNMSNRVAIATDMAPNDAYHSMDR